jgi:hypothetical protein
LLACIGNEGRDALLESLVSTRPSSRKQASGLLHPTIFDSLFNSIEAKGESRNAFIKRYLRDWYVALKPTYWIDSHKKPKSGTFFGYWAVEVAGVVKAFGMDDSAFREMPYSYCVNKIMALYASLHSSREERWVQANGLIGT